MVENLPANAGDTGSSPGLGGSHMPRSGWAREPQQETRVRALVWEDPTCRGAAGPVSHSC